MVVMVQSKGTATPAASAASRLWRMGLASREQFESVVRFLDGTDAAGLDHAGLEERLDRDGRELLRRLLDDHLALRAVREQRLGSVVGEDEVTRGRVEHDHRRVLGTVFGKVTVSRMAYRAPGRGNLHPADAALNLPVERHSHGLRKLAALEAARGSFQDAVDGIERACGQRLAKCQVEELAQIAAVDFEDFYEKRRPARSEPGDLLVISADGEGDRDERLTGRRVPRPLRRGECHRICVRQSEWRAHAFNTREDSFPASLV